MSLRDVHPRHLRLIGLYAARHAVRGGTGILFLVLTLTTGLMTAHFLTSPVEAIKHRTRVETGRTLEDREILDELAQRARPAVAWALTSGSNETLGGGGDGDGGDSGDPAAGEDPAEVWAAFLLDERPALLSAVFLMLLFCLPFLITFGAFNLYSGDIGSRGLRYHLLRTERPNLFLGRFLGTALFTISVMVFLLVVIVAYVGLKLDAYTWPDLLWWSGRGVLAFVLVSLPYVAFCAWISASVDSPFLSLVVSSLVIGGVPMFALLGRASWEPIGYLTYLLPWGLQNYLLHHQLPVVLAAAGACLGYTAVFLYLGLRHFARRDL